ncbi:hypothetical protein BDW22DRAFT_1432751 [Trametopsis cervina]|nr:hypothetical protein BDW22DRAFT_1432751 [Trametopsis cervina]
MPRKWSDAEWDWLTERLSREDVTKLYAQVPARVQELDAAGVPVKMARGRPRGLPQGVFKEIAAIIEAEYRQAFANPLEGETNAEFKKRKGVRKAAGLTSKQNENETREACEIRLDVTQLRQRLMDLVSQKSPNRIRGVTFGRLPATDHSEGATRAHTAFSVFKASRHGSGEGSVNPSGEAPFRIGDWNMATKRDFEALPAEAVARLESEAKDLNEQTPALSVEILQLAKQGKIADLQANISDTHAFWKRETEWRAVTIAGGLIGSGTSERVDTIISHNILNGEGLSLVQYLCKQLACPEDRFLLEVSYFFTDALRPLDSMTLPVDSSAPMEVVEAVVPNGQEASYVGVGQGAGEVLEVHSVEQSEAETMVEAERGICVHEEPADTSLTRAAMPADEEADNMIVESEPGDDAQGLGDTDYAGGVNGVVSAPEPVTEGTPAIDQGQGGVVAVSLPAESSRAKRKGTSGTKASAKRRGGGNHSRRKSVGLGAGDNGQLITSEPQPATGTGVGVVSRYGRAVRTPKHATEEYDNVVERQIAA